MSVFFSDLQGKFDVECGVCATFPLKISTCLVNSITVDKEVHPLCNDDGHHIVGDVEEANYLLVFHFGRSPFV